MLSAYSSVNGLRFCINKCYPERRTVMTGKSVTSGLGATGCCVYFLISPADCGAYFYAGCGFSSVALKSDT